MDEKLDREDEEDELELESLHFFVLNIFGLRAFFTAFSGFDATDSAAAPAATPNPRPAIVFKPPGMFDINVPPDVVGRVGFAPCGD